jgi:hypothetical protein
MAEDTGTATIEAPATAPAAPVAPQAEPSAPQEQDNYSAEYAKAFGKDATATPADAPAPSRTRGPDGKFAPKTNEQPDPSKQPETANATDGPVTLAELFSAKEITALKRAAGAEGFDELEKLAASGFPASTIKRFAGLADTALANIARKWEHGPGSVEQAQGQQNGDPQQGPTAAQPQQPAPPQSNPFEPFQLSKEHVEAFDDVYSSDALSKPMSEVIGGLSAHVSEQLNAVHQFHNKQLDDVRQKFAADLGMVKVYLGRRMFNDTLKDLRQQPGYESLQKFTDEQRDNLEEEVGTLVVALRNRGVDPDEAVRRATVGGIAAILKINPVHAAQIGLANTAATVRAGNLVLPEQSTMSPTPLSQEEYEQQAYLLTHRDGLSAEQVKARLGPMKSD